MHAEGQAITRRANVGEQRVETVALKANDVQHRPENFALERLDPVDLDQGRRHEGVVREVLRQGESVHRVTRTPHRRDVALDRLARVAVDHRSDVGRESIGIAGRELAHRALEHVQHRGSDLVLQAQHAQRRAALPGGIERRMHRVLHHLLRQRRRVDDHRVLAAGLGDERYRALAIAHVADT